MVKNKGTNWHQRLLISWYQFFAIFKGSEEVFGWTTVYVSGGGELVLSHASSQVSIPGSFLLVTEVTSSGTLAKENFNVWKG